MHFIRVVLLLILTSLAAWADLAITLTPGAQLANRETETIFSGTLTNTGSTDIFLNDISFNLISATSTYFTVDRNFFFASVPGVLSPGETYSGPIFKMSVLKAPLGSYTGTVSILGGSDIFAQSSLPTVPFTVQVAHRPPKRIR